ncbi:hypothetical protein OH77DRAFT_1594599 [Trametes cingulata]|nr:hypothetical protein OH77DRAFT_1594599 [Trametes cingulata]
MPDKSAPGADVVTAPALKSFTAVEMEQMTALAIELDPYLAPRKEKGIRWDQVAKRLHEQNLCVQSTGKTIKNKVEALLTHHTTPNPNSYISKELEKNQAVKARMPALLDRLTGLKAAAHKVKEDAVNHARKINEEKNMQGAHIRHMSMIAMGSATSPSKSPERGTDHSNGTEPTNSVGSISASPGSDAHEGRASVRSGVQSGTHAEAAGGKTAEPGRPVLMDHTPSTPAWELRDGKENMPPGAGTEEGHASAESSKKRKRDDTPTTSTATGGPSDAGPQSNDPIRSSTDRTKRQRLQAPLAEFADLLRESREEDRRMREEDRRSREQLGTQMLSVLQESLHAQVDFQDRLLTLISSLRE